MEAQVKEMLRQRKTYMAERTMLTLFQSDLPGFTESVKASRLKQLDLWLTIIDGWLLLLTEDEAFVIRRHLIDQIDWPRITLEYEKIWGVAYAKAERTLRSYQKSALIKIVRFTSEHAVPLI